MSHLTRTDPTKNMARFYRLDIAPTLFGDWTLIAEWGRIGQGGTLKAKAYTDEASARAAMVKKEQRKRGRGYA